MTLKKLQTKPLKLVYGLLLLLAIVVVSTLIMIASLPDAFSYCAPDANHILPGAILVLIAAVGICATFIIKMEKTEATRNSRFVAIISIIIAFLIISGSRNYYSYNTRKGQWIKKNMIGFYTKDINTYKYEDIKHINFFGNVLVYDKDSVEIFLRDHLYSSPVLYLPNGSKKALNMVITEQENHEYAFFNEKKGQTLGVMGSDMNIIVKPNTYKNISSMGNYRFLCVENDSYKYGLLNLKGEIVIPCQFDCLVGNGRWTNKNGILLDGGFMYALKGEEALLIDTLCNTLSFDEYQKKFPKENMVMDEGLLFVHKPPIPEPPAPELPEEEEEMNEEPIYFPYTDVQ